MVFSGAGKSRLEIEKAIELGVLAINVESESELFLIHEIAKNQKKEVSIHLRVNPNISVETNPYIATGLYQTKFGIADEAVSKVVEQLRGKSEIHLRGIACHIGSQITDLESFKLAASRMKTLALELKQSGHPISRVDMGGGLGIAYRSQEVAPAVEAYAQSVLPMFQGTSLQLILEPGRSIVGNAGGLLTQVLHIKKNRERHFTIVDAAMTDLIRPSLYEAYHEIIPVSTLDRDPVTTDIVGPVCETGDFLGLGRKITEPSSGELLWVQNAGAYGTTMSSHYNSRPKIAEVLVEGSQVHLICRRETVEDLWRQEI
jgi:diaminopimelate decarboxylase